MPPFKFVTQINIVVAIMALHNYIRRSAFTDLAFEKFDSNPEFVHMSMIMKIFKNLNSFRM